MADSQSSTSPASSPRSMASPAATTLTPSRKVQALLAQFGDSESDSDTQDPNAISPTAAKAVSSPAPQSKIKGFGRPALQSEDGSEDEDILPMVSRSRMAARLQGLGGTDDPVAVASHQSPPDMPEPAAADVPAEGGQVPATGMRRRLLTKRKSSPVHSTASEHTRPAASSSVSSPNSTRFDDNVPYESEENDSEAGEKLTGAGKSKFLALVEKHRKQRLEKEAEEDAKRAARLENMQAQEAAGAKAPRGSSPADDTDEESGNSEAEAGKKLSTQARPSRKASKKAVEEMKRETQRMSRNMQLAHQARTKKKITKDSLLARFNLLPAQPAPVAPNVGSSGTGSDTDADKDHDTPPTSPMHMDLLMSSPGKQRSVHDPPHVLSNSRVGGISMSTEAPPQTDKGKGRAGSIEPFDDSTLSHTLRAVPALLDDRSRSSPPLQPTAKSKYSKKSLAAIVQSRDSDSESDLEVITAHGNIRKYAAFEKLGKPKARETPSHLALRALAQLNGGDHRKASMNAAQMEAALRKAARMQAQQERQEKIAELKAKGVVVQTAEEREREQQEVEDLLERARQEAVEIQKREKAVAKKEGNYTKDGLDDEDSDDDEDFQDEEENLEEESGSDDEDEESLDEAEGAGDGAHLVDDEADDDEDDDDNVSDSPSLASDVEDVIEDLLEGARPDQTPSTAVSRKHRVQRVVSDDDDDDLPTVDKHQSPQLPTVAAKTPQSLARSARKQIPGLQMSDDLPIGLTQAFAATLAETETQEQDSLTMTMDLPSPNIQMVPILRRMDSVDVITDSQPASQTQPLNVNLSFSQLQTVPQSPAIGHNETAQDFTPSQPHFEPTQDGAYMLSPFTGNRFAMETPQRPSSTVETVLMPNEMEESPIVRRKGRLQRGQASTIDMDDASVDTSAFDVMRVAAQKTQKPFDKLKSNAKEVVDDAAEESEDEYAGLGGVSDEDFNDEENEDDRRMIDEDTQVGVGDEAKLAKLFADRERQQDEAAVSKLLKDITTGALRRKRANDDLDLSDDEDAAMRRREAKRREFAKMRRELLKDEAVGKIAEDKRKEAFLRSIEDRLDSDDDEDFDLPETPAETESQDKASLLLPPSESSQDRQPRLHSATLQDGAKQPLDPVSASRLNEAQRPTDRAGLPMSRRPVTLAEIRESVSFLIEEPDSQAASVEALSDSDDEPEAYVNLDRHLQMAETDENGDDEDDLGDFIVDDDGQANADATFKKPALPYSQPRAPFSERRTKPSGNVVNRLTQLRQSSSTSGSSNTTQQAFYGSGSGSGSSAHGAFSKVPSLLRRATTNSSLGSMAGRDETVSATGVVTSKPERGQASDEREFVRKSSGGQQNAVNYRPTIREEKMSQRAGIAKKNAAKNRKAGGGFLGGLFRQDSWT